MAEQDSGHSGIEEDAIDTILSAFKNTSPRFGTPWALLRNSKDGLSPGSAQQRSKRDPLSYRYSQLLRKVGLRVYCLLC